MANTNKTKAEILQELESIKGLLLEEDDIPILQEMEDEDMFLEDDDLEVDGIGYETFENDFHPEPPMLTLQASVLPGQTSLFDEPLSAATKISHQLNKTTFVSHESKTRPSQLDQEHKKSGYASQLSGALSDNRPLAKASGENPFLPQHIRERLHGNNPPPLFEYETAKKIIRSTKNIAHKTSKPRQYLVEEVMLSMMPQIEIELRHRLFAMSVEDLERLLNDDED